MTILFRVLFLLMVAFFLVGWLYPVADTGKLFARIGMLFGVGAMFVGLWRLIYK